MQDDCTITGRYWRDNTVEFSIVIGPDDTEVAIKNEVEYGDLYEATCRWFVDKLGFTSSGFILTDVTKHNKGIPHLRMTFIDDGITMAKLQDII